MSRLLAVLTPLVLLAGFHLHNQGYLDWDSSEYLRRSAQIREIFAHRGVLAGLSSLYFVRAWKPVPTPLLGVLPWILSGGHALLAAAWTDLAGYLALAIGVTRLFRRWLLPAEPTALGSLAALFVLTQPWLLQLGTGFTPELACLTAVVFALDAWLGRRPRSAGAWMGIAICFGPIEASLLGVLLVAPRIAATAMAARKPCRHILPALAWLLAIPAAWLLPFHESLWGWTRERAFGSLGGAAWGHHASLLDSLTHAGSTLLSLPSYPTLLILQLVVAARLSLLLMREKKEKKKPGDLRLLLTLSGVALAVAVPLIAGSLLVDPRHHTDFRYFVGPALALSITASLGWARTRSVPIGVRAGLLATLAALQCASVGILLFPASQAARQLAVLTEPWAAAPALVPRARLTSDPDVEFFSELERALPAGDGATPLSVFIAQTENSCGFNDVPILSLLAHERHRHWNFDAVWNRALDADETLRAAHERADYLLVGPLEGKTNPYHAMYAATERLLTAWSEMQNQPPPPNQRRKKGDFRRAQSPGKATTLPEGWMPEAILPFGGSCHLWLLRKTPFFPHLPSPTPPAISRR